MPEALAYTQAGKDVGESRCGCHRCTGRRLDDRSPPIAPAAVAVVAEMRQEIACARLPYTDDPATRSTPNQISK